MRKPLQFAALLTLLVVVVVSWRTECLRFESPRLNYGVFGMAVFASWFMPAAPFARTPAFVGILVWGLKTVVLPVLFAGWLFVVCLWNPDPLWGNVDHSFERQAVLVIDGSRYHVYRTNGGATTAYGTVVRKETRVAPGLNWVERVFHKYPAFEITGYQLMNGWVAFEAR
jgi:hypothetical protein